MRNLPLDTDIIVSSHDADKYNLLRDDNIGWIGESGDEYVDFSSMDAMDIERIKVDFLTREELNVQGSGFTPEEQAFLDSFTDLFAPDGYSYHGLLIPLYANPQTWLTDTVWDKLIAIIKLYPNVPFKIVINPDNGAGSSVNSDYTTLIERIRETHAEILGYITTNYGSIAEAVVKSDMDDWVAWYDIDGFFFDETSGDWTTYEDYYTSLVDYAGTIGITGSIVGGCDTMPDSGLFTQFDIVTTSKSPVYPSSPELPIGIDYSQKCCLYYGSDFSESELNDNLLPNFGWTYLNTTEDWDYQNTYNLVRNILASINYDRNYIQEQYHPLVDYGYRVNVSSWYGKEVTNVFDSPQAPVSQSIVIDGYASVSCYTGSISCAYGTATPSSPLLFHTDSSENVAFTVSGDCTYPMVVLEQFSPPYASPTLPERVADYAVSSMDAVFKIRVSESYNIQLVYGIDDIIIGYGDDEVIISEYFDQYLCRFYEDIDNYITIRLRNDISLCLDGLVAGNWFSEAIAMLDMGDNSIVVAPTELVVNGVPYPILHEINPVNMEVGYDGSHYFNDQILEITY